jgi:Lipocalin-like domain
MKTLSFLVILIMGSMGGHMNRHITLSLFALTALGLALLPSGAISQQKSLKEQLVGTWTIVSNDNVAPDGTKRQIFGPNPQGILIFDANGRYALMFMQPGRPKFQAKNRLRGTPEEIKAAFEGALVHFGTWSVTEADKVIVLRTEGALYPNQEGTEGKRTIVTLTADELKMANPASGAGGTTEAVFRRAK